MQSPLFFICRHPPGNGRVIPCGKPCGFAERAFSPKLRRRSSAIKNYNIDKTPCKAENGVILGKIRLFAAAFS
jgi:hypothetical protein